MQLHLDGSNVIRSPQSRVYALLTDADFIARTLPDADDVHVIDPQSLEAKIKLRVAVVSSTMKVKMTISKTAPTSKATLVAEGTGSGSSMKITSVFELSGDAPTDMRWSADAEITGVMAGLGSSLLKGFATKKVAEIFEGITRAVESAS
ncbi:MAG: carbon monoxide dehydrogenase subunit G [Nitrososphaerota archaeon]|jgi:carbon monoxide dehydrogenase subunit G|nr:carbon monoxide dehydrogenase subunit G [Nitrososphaerota archaeon]MDG6912946.1 carbon monoxide dehydrogenase subunit G [Nitrososphaerota archaeon]MDG6937284.1 carbon monoxide dehydrogenase subunit G [Nitrososphaerota archaeon]MDG6961356.1 carbon monoxide dehydrogenase subunit G [Nitrososphaerota archaeon]MDG6962826.1 carbon monoxide dehydrogenase subunit G [Nitrososphaerota archaeon]